MIMTHLPASRGTPLDMTNYVEWNGLDCQVDMLHGHTPWIVILVKKMEEWKAAHGGSLPSFQERKDFQQRYGIEVAAVCPASAGLTVCLLWFDCFYLISS